MSRPSKPFSLVTDEILAEVDAVERVKTAEAEAVRAATPRFTTEIGQLLHKAAEEVRSSSREVTYQDVQDYLGGQL